MLLSGRRPALHVSLYLVPSRKRRVATYVCRFALCICTLNRSLNLSSCCICIPLAPSCKYTCRAHSLLSMLSMASSRGKRVLQPHPCIQQEPGAGIAVTPGSVNGPRSISNRETEFYYARHSRWRSQQRLHVAVHARTCMPTYPY